MAKIEASTTVDRPIEKVWNFMIDASNLPKWVPGNLEGRITSEGPIGMGATLQMKNSGWPKLVEFRVTEYEPGRKTTMEVTTPQMIKGSVETFTLENAEGKTKVNMTMDLKLNGLSSLVGPFVARTMKKEGQTEVGNLKRILES